MTELPPNLEQSACSGSPRLRRVLRLHDLIFYGIVIVQPIAPVPIFGIAQELSRGHAVTTILAAGIAMMLTAFSYGRMAALYPFAGSAYSYVGRGLNPHLGFLAGWAMSLDYLVLPIVAIIQASLTVQRLLPAVPYSAWVAFFVMLLTAINLRGVRTTARTNIVLLFAMFAVIGAFVILAIEYLLRRHGMLSVFSTQPFYSPGTFQLRAIATATSFAALTYIGFDGVTTLAEEVENPRRNILLATVLTCVLTTLFSCLLVYLAQLVWADYHTFPNIETAFMDVTRTVGGATLFQGMGVVIMLGSLGSGLSGQVAAARLLFGMGRDNVLPRKVFGYLDPARNNPTFNIILVGLLALVGSLIFNLEHAGELLNFGAFLAFMGVNLAAMKQYYFVQSRRQERRLIGDAVVPALGFLFCLGMWLGLPIVAKIVGGLWFAVGLGYDAIRTGGFRTRPVMINFGDC
jgi:putrescine importer